jgi:hypothetical protein
MYMLRKRFLIRKQEFVRGFTWEHYFLVKNVIPNDTEGLYATQIML